MSTRQNENDVESTTTNAKAYRREEFLIIAEEGYGWITSDVTGADILNGDA